MDTENGSELSYFSREFLEKCGLEETVMAVTVSAYVAGLRSVKDEHEAARFVRGHIDWSRPVVKGTPWEVAEEREHENNCVDWARRMLETEKASTEYWITVLDTHAYRTPRLPEGAVRRAGSIYEPSPDVGF